MNLKSVKSFIDNKISIHYVIVCMTISSITTFFIASHFGTDKNKPDVEIHAKNTNCSYNIKRWGGFGYIGPIMFVDNECESERLASVKQQISTLIENYKHEGTLNSASVYLKDYATNDWTVINESETFKPGSLLKIPELITVLKMNELKSGFLDKELLYEHSYALDKDPKYLSKSIQLGQKYTVKELLTYMIAYSDNCATSLLMANIDVKLFKKVFTDLGLKSPDMTASDYPITSKEYSYFMRILFNASYLNIQDSEYATELLSKCNFKEGIVSSMPSTIKIAHKFGEAGDPLEKQLHETAIIYLSERPYLITIMTKGKDLSKLPLVLRQISSTAYQGMLNLSN